MDLRRFLKKMERAGAQPALVWKDEVCTFAALAESVKAAARVLKGSSVPSGAVVVLETDYSPGGIGMLLALIENRNIIVPLTEPDDARRRTVVEAAAAEYLVRCDGAAPAVERLGGGAAAKTIGLFERLRQASHAGLVLFTSGTTGAPKGVVHDLAALLKKFNRPGHSKRTVAFMIFDHIGGLDTLFYTLFNFGCLLIPAARTPEAVAELISKHKAQVLPASPTFLNLFLLGETHKRFDLTSLEVITYGAEPMPEHVLKRLAALFPGVRLLQKYGLSELGAVRIKSKSSDSLWIKIGGTGLEVRVRDGMLELKTQTAMLGYLNAPSPFTRDGWFKTGDSVEQDGEYFRILGRNTDIVNIGGEKVHPAEIENILMSMEGVEDAVVSGEKSPLSGQMITAAVELRTGETLSDFRVRMRRYFQDHGLPSYKIPQKVVFGGKQPEAGRRKKTRRSA